MAQHSRLWQNTTRKEGGGCEERAMEVTWHNHAAKRQPATWESWADSIREGEKLIPAVERGGHTSGLSPIEARNRFEIFHIPSNSWLDPFLTFSKQRLSPALLAPSRVLRDQYHFRAFQSVSTESIEGAGAFLARCAEGLDRVVGSPGKVLGSWGCTDGKRGGQPRAGMNICFVFRSC